MAAAGKPLSEYILELCDEMGTDDTDRMSHLQDAVSVLRERMRISAAKAEGGTMGEFWVAQKFGLKWESEKKTGADAHDKEGRECEIKASLHPPKTKIHTSKTNICYKTPSRRAGETNAAFVARTQEHVRQNTGGHFWATWTTRSTGDTGERVKLSWWIPSVTLAQLIGKKMRASADMGRRSRVIHINFGGKVCSTCGSVHRIDAIVGALGGWNSRDDDLETLGRLREEDADELDNAALAHIDAGNCRAQCE